jgi:hypothetical protein
MKSRIYLPMQPPVFFPQNERDQLINRLYELRYLVPDAKTLDIMHLRDIVQYAEEKAVAEKVARIKAGAEIAAKMPPEQVKAALSEFIKKRNKKLRSEGKIEGGNW